jgi:hypothetical protein
MSTETLFEQLSKVNVNDKTEKKGKFTYLSWAFAWGELKKVAPDAKVTVYHNEADNMPYFTSDAGVIVKVGVEVNGIEHISYLPLMDFKNKSISSDSFDMMDVNKAIQRATVKAIGLHGLGLYIYAGEDLPEEEQDGKPKKTSSRKKEEEPKEDKPKRTRRDKKDDAPEESVEEQSNEKAPKKRGRGFRRK